MMAVAAPRPASGRQNHESMRRGNLSAVLRVVHDASEISRAELTTRVQLARGTVGGLLDELEELGLVGTRQPLASHSAGRPSKIVGAGLGRVRILAADIGADHINFGLLGLGGTLFTRNRRPTPKAWTPSVVADEVASGLHNIVEGLPADARVIGAGVGIPGIVEDHQLVRSAPNLGWTDVPFAELLREQLPHGMEVMMANGADLGALAELRRGAARGRSNVVYIGCDDFGVGGGLILNGAQYFGATGYAGEVGHMPINPSGRLCHCGGRGCWETEIGTARLAEVLGTPNDVSSVAAALLATQTPSPELYAVGTFLGQGIASIINVLNVEQVVLSGTLTQLYTALRAATDEAIRTYALSALRAVVSVELSQLNQSGPLLGAAELFAERLITDPLMLVTRP